MKPFLPNQQQLEAISNGATKIFIPIDVPKGFLFYKLRFNNGWTVSHFNKEEVTRQVISPLEKGKPYFVQEEHSMNGGFPLYTTDFRDSMELQKFDDYTPADQMTEEQSRLKFTVTDVEVRQSKSIDIVTVQDLRGSFTIAYNKFRFGMWHDRQYPEQPYSQNLHGFLVSIERI